jgi:hypothetical protein
VSGEILVVLGKRHLVSGETLVVSGKRHVVLGETLVVLGKRLVAWGETLLVLETCLVASSETLVVLKECLFPLGEPLLLCTKRRSLDNVPLSFERTPDLPNQASRSVSSERLRPRGWRFSRDSAPGAGGARSPFQVRLEG